ncbi:MAG: homoserine O-acetyltransferase MetX, partial [Lysobacterales bacterium]
VYLSRAMDWFNVADGYDDLVSSLAHIKLESACVIGVESDILFPLHQQRELASALAVNRGAASLVELPSENGHDSFLVDYERFKPAINDYFQQILASE